MKLTIRGLDIQPRHVILCRETTKTLIKVYSTKKVKEIVFAGV